MKKRQRKKNLKKWFMKTAFVIWNKLEYPPDEYARLALRYNSKTREYELIEVKSV